MQLLGDSLGSCQRRCSLVSGAVILNWQLPWESPIDYISSTVSGYIRAGSWGRKVRDPRVGKQWSISCRSSTFKRAKAKSTELSITHHISNPADDVTWGKSLNILDRPPSGLAECFSVSRKNILCWARTQSTFCRLTQEHAINSISDATEIETWAELVELPNCPWAGQLYLTLWHL